MANYSKSKKLGTKAYPADTKESSNLFRRAEPLLTPEDLISRYLKNIPNIDTYTSDELKTEIEIAMNEIEVFTGIHLFKTQMKERVPYDHNLYKSFLFMKMNHRPILSVEKISVESTNGQTIYEIPLEWVESGFFHKGQINLLPILSVFGSTGSIVNGVPSGALIFLQGLSNFQFVPAFWMVEYTTGVSHKEGEMPVIINDLIGLTTAINLLNSLQSLNIYNSQSLSQDGISQSSSSAGPQIYQKKIEHLEQRRERILAQVKKIFHSKFFMSNI